MNARERAKRRRTRDLGDLDDLDEFAHCEPRLAISLAFNTDVNSGTLEDQRAKQEEVRFEFTPLEDSIFSVTSNRGAPVREFTVPWLAVRTVYQFDRRKHHGERR